MKYLALVAIFVAVAVFLMLLRASRNERRAEADYPPSGQFVTVSGQRIHLKVEGQGPPIVLIHGASGSLRDMTFALAPALSDRFTVISVDRPGLGYSPPLPNSGETLKAQADLLAAAIRKLGFSRVYLLGQSYGGSVALKWTLDHPDMVAGLLLVSAPSNVWDGGLGALYALNANPLSGPILRLFVSAFPPNTLIRKTIKTIFAPQKVPDGFIEHLGTPLTLRRASQRANALQLAALKDQLRPMASRYGEISVPVEVVHGTADTIVPETVHTENIARQIGNFNATLLPGIGHMPHQTNTDAVIAAARRLDEKAGLQRLE